MDSDSFKNICDFIMTVVFAEMIRWTPVLSYNSCVWFEMFLCAVLWTEGANKRTEQNHVTSSGAAGDLLCSGGSFVWHQQNQWLQQCDLYDQHIQR